MEPIVEVTEVTSPQKLRTPVSVKRSTRTTPSRESSSDPVESPSLRRSTRIRKSSVTEEHAVQLQPCLLNTMNNIIFINNFF
jgi:hypothetical protein